MDTDDDTDDKQVEVEPHTAAEVVQAGLQGSDLCCESIKLPWIDKVEEQMVQQHGQDRSKYDYSPRKSTCCKSISVERYRSVWNDMAELTHNELHDAGDGRMFDSRIFVMSRLKEGANTHNLLPQW